MSADAHMLTAGAASSRPDRASLILATLSVLLLYIPVLVNVNNQVWGTVEQSYGPVILSASVWFFWQRRNQLASLSSEDAAPIAGFSALGIALVLYVLGRTQQIMAFDTFSAIPMIIALLLLFKGWSAVRVCVLPLVLLLFVVPLPADLVAALTGPLKAAVSAVAETILAWLGYPIARTGVILMVGQYQLLVADACAGLTSIFTLETIGLVYLGIRNYSSRARNIVLTLLLVPIAFVANIVRVVILVLVTYHFGEAAGQGFVHGVAGILLFMVATVLMLSVDKLLGFISWRSPQGVRQ